MIVLELHPCKGRPGLYEARIGPVTVVRSRQPFFAAARELLERGVDPSVELVARHAGSPILAMRSTVGEAARWTVSEPDRGRMQKKPWSPHPKANSSHPEAPENARSGFEPMSEPSEASNAVLGDPSTETEATE